MSEIEVEKYFTDKFNAKSFADRVEIGDYRAMAQYEELRRVKYDLIKSHRKKIASITERMNYLIKEMAKHRKEATP